ncbi:MAG: hypothetical protein ACFE8U_04400 [Candidatus Hermodarchaeota archaeon]
MQEKKGEPAIFRFKKKRFGMRHEIHNEDGTKFLTIKQAKKIDQMPPQYKIINTEEEEIGEIRRKTPYEYEIIDNKKEIYATTRLDSTFNGRNGYIFILVMKTPLGIFRSPEYELTIGNVLSFWNKTRTDVYNSAGNLCYSMKKSQIDSKGVLSPFLTCVSAIAFKELYNAFRFFFLAANNSW